MTNPIQTQNGHPAPPAPVATPVFSEAPASVTLKISYRGYNDILFTLRDASGVSLLDKLNVVMDRFEKMGITPSAARNSSPAAAGGDAPVCPEHNMSMKQGRRGWYCPKMVGEVQGRKIYCKHTA